MSAAHDPARSEAEIATIREQVIARWWDVYWTCGECHKTFPKDHDPDYCCVRLRRNDDVRIALAEALR
jgi:hypothetical protein